MIQFIQKGIVSQLQPPAPLFREQNYSITPFMYSGTNIRLHLLRSKLNIVLSLIRQARPMQFLKGLSFPYPSSFTGFDIQKPSLILFAVICLMYSVYNMPAAHGSSAEISSSVPAQIIKTSSFDFATRQQQRSYLSCRL